MSIGQELLDVPFPEMIFKMAKAIAQGQTRLDKSSLDTAKSASRQAWFPGGWRETAVWSRLALPAGATVEGPAILEQPDATTVIEPGHVGRVDPLGNVIVEARA